MESSAQSQIKTRRLSYSQRKKIVDGLVIAMLVIVSAIMLMPVLIMVTTSLKTAGEVMAYPPTIIPKVPTLENYPEMFRTLSFGRQFLNSLTVAGLSTLGTVISSSFVAFGVYRYRAPGKNLLFMVVLSTMMIPYAAYMIPQFILFMNIGWVNTFLPLIAPSFFGSAYSIFLFRQFFSGIPYDLFEAARIDGAGELRSFWSIALRLSGPVIAAVAIFTFIQCWDDILGPVIYLNDANLYTLPLGLSGFRGKFKITPWHQLMAAALATSIVPLLLFMFFQRYFVEGIVFSGIKG